MPDKEVITATSSYDYTDRSNLKFKTRKDLDKDFTEYYNLIYTYKTDCLEANFEYNKKFYRDGSMVTDQNIFFTLTILAASRIFKLIKAELCIKLASLSPVKINPAPP